MHRAKLLSAVATLAVACTSTTLPSTGSTDAESKHLDAEGLSYVDMLPSDAKRADGGGAYQYDSATGTDACPEEHSNPCPSPVPQGCVGAETCNNGLDDNCDGQVDENCACAIGDVQPCFAGPPGRADVGACVRGTQNCIGGGEFGSWGACENGMWPRAEVCDDLDNDCNGCADDGLCCEPFISCPDPSKIPDGQPFTTYQLDGTQYFSDTVDSWSWTVEGGGCDALLGNSFTLNGADTATPTIDFTLSGDYTVTMTVDTQWGVFSCSFIIHVMQLGMRVELCWEGTGTRDLDLHLLREDLNATWCDNAFDCYFATCKAQPSSGILLDWGYANTPLSSCEGGPEGSLWQSIGGCRNPRLDIDNVNKTGVPENINVDNPNHGDIFRVMVHHYHGSGEPHPLVNVYCDGYRVATYGQAPSLVTGFDLGGSGCNGHTWRVADILTSVQGGVTTCTVNALHPPGQTSGYHIREHDKQYD